MEKIFFTGPKYNNQIEITAENIPELYNDLIKGFPLYWKQGNYSCTFEIFTDDILQKRLRIGFFEELGLCLTYEQLYDRLFKGEIRRGVKADLAVYDESKLETVVDVYFESYTSEGLLLPPELAWKGIQYFNKTAEKAPAIKWSPSNDIPDTGNCS